MTGIPAVHLDCTAGVAGDMLLGALLHAGADVAAVRAGLDAVGAAGLGIDVQHTRRAGLACRRAVVHAPTEPDPNRGLGDVLAILATATLAAAPARFAVATFRLLADADATVRAADPERAPLHELGTLDAIADVVAVAVALDSLGLLGPDVTATCSAFAAGSGTTTGPDGQVPVPVPTVAEIVAQYRFGFTGAELAGQRSTPTGVALAAAFARPGPMPPMTVHAVGSGAGARDTPERPNITRVLVGRASQAAPVAEHVVVVETTVDDLDPRLWPSVLAAVRDAGAWDCWTTATVGRHGRPGQVLTALCAGEVRESVLDALFRHTGTLGVRWAPWQRTALRRTTVSVPVEGRGVGVKVGYDDTGVRTVTPELADAERVAAELGISVRSVSELAVSAYRQRHPDSR